MQINDGIVDCTDFSDECPKNRTIAGDIFSSKYEMIDGMFFRVMLVIMATISCIGNLVGIKAIGGGG